MRLRLEKPHRRSRYRFGQTGQKVLIAIGTIALIGLIGFSVVRQSSKTQITTENSATLKSKELENSSTSVNLASKVPADWVEIGGIMRPPTDVDVSDSVVGISNGRRSPVPLKPEGFPAPVLASTNAQTMMVAEALKTGENPERYSSFIVPESFDADAFKADPEGYAKKYAEVVEPGRVYASAQPVDGTTSIRCDGDRLHRVKQGEVVRLNVESAPFAPVTFTSQQLGHFPNSLSSITVVADAQGKATAEFTAASGTKDNVDILAASPVTSGQVRFVVIVSPSDIAS